MAIRQIQRAGAVAGNVANQASDDEEGIDYGDALGSAAVGAVGGALLGYGGGKLYDLNNG